MMENGVHRSIHNLVIFITLLRFIIMLCGTDNIPQKHSCIFPHIFITNDVSQQSGTKLDWICILKLCAY